MPQAIHTGSGFCEERFVKSQMKTLDDLNAGDMAGLTFEEIATLQPAVYAARKRYSISSNIGGLVSVESVTLTLSTACGRHSGIGAQEGPHAALDAPGSCACPSVLLFGSPPR
jgi:hypothetical protein